LECDIDDEFGEDKSKLNLKKIDDAHYIGEYNRERYIVTILWIIDPESWWTRPGLCECVILDNYIFVSRGESDFYVFDIDGNFIWKQRLYGGNGIIYILCSDNYLLFITSLRSPNSNIRNTYRKCTFKNFW